MTQSLTDTEIYDALYKLLPSQLGEVLLLAAVPAHHLSASTQAARALDIVHWAGQATANREALRVALGQARQTIAADPLLAWQQACFESFRQIRVVGFEDREKIRLDLDHIFVPLQLRAGRAKGPTPGRLDKGGDYLEAPVTVDLAQALALAERLRDEGRATKGVVVLGDPGAGKTTLLRHLYCRVLAEGSAAVGCSRS